MKYESIVRIVAEIEPPIYAMVYTEHTQVK